MSSLVHWPRSLLCPIDWPSAALAMTKLARQASYFLLSWRLSYLMIDTIWHWKLYCSRPLSSLARTRYRTGRCFLAAFKCGQEDYFARGLRSIFVGKQLCIACAALLLPWRCSLFWLKFKFKFHLFPSSVGLAPHQSACIAHKRKLEKISLAKWHQINECEHTQKWLYRIKLYQFKMCLCVFFSLHVFNYVQIKLYHHKQIFQFFLTIYLKEKR